MVYFSYKIMLSLSERWVKKKTKLPFLVVLVCFFLIYFQQIHYYFNTLGDTPWSLRRIPGNRCLQQRWSLRAHTFQSLSPQGSPMPKCPIVGDLKHIPGYRSFRSGAVLQTQVKNSMILSCGCFLPALTTILAVIGSNT